MQAVATITITLGNDSRVYIDGAIQDKIFALGLIELAKKIIIEYVPPTIVQPSNGDVQRIQKAN